MKKHTNIIARSRLRLVTLCVVMLLCGTIGGYALLRNSSAANIQGDLDGNDKVTITDLSILLKNFGQIASSAILGDINGDGKIDIRDLSTLLSNFGKSAPVSTAPKLRWAPPAGWQNYTVVQIPDSATAAGNDSAHCSRQDPITKFYTDYCIRLDANKDYLIKFPATPRHGGVNIQGGRNIVIIGGASINDGSDFMNGFTRGLFFFDTQAKDVSGTNMAASAGVPRTIHIEGWSFLGSVNGADPIVKADGINLNTPAATVQIQNVRTVDLRGNSVNYARDSSGTIYADGTTGRTSGVTILSKSDYNARIAAGTITFWKNEHADMLQPFGGTKELRVDRFTGTGNCQGFFLQQNNVIGKITLSNINLRYQNVAPAQCGDLLWLTSYDTAGNPCKTAPNGVTLSEVYLSGGYGYGVWPKTYATGCPAVFNSTTSTITWPNLPLVSGAARIGVPAADFVPATGTNSPGVTYTSPGYQ
jgi:hypothetical protein